MAGMSRVSTWPKQPNKASGEGQQTVGTVIQSTRGGCSWWPPTLNSPPSLPIAASGEPLRSGVRPLRSWKFEGSACGQGLGGLGG
jgi:hypothetical protein